MFGILQYLSPHDLLRVSILSKMWRSRALDAELWRNLFRREGWIPDIPRVRHFEATERARVQRSKGRKMRGRPSISEIDTQVSKKRASDRRQPAPPSIFQDNGANSENWAEQYGQVEADDGPSSSPDERMEDVTFSDSTSLPTSEDSTALPTPTSPMDRLQPPVKPALLVEEANKDAKMNWQFLYKQKRRLEENWNAGSYTNFQLPHPSHPEEGHNECVYTIQYSPQHLVSGSRDKTIKIWDLETQRLKNTLEGHNASVLCLQFDERPEHDLVVSGGSDCHVLIWRFSTGELIKTLRHAHNESVLNLRFDDHFLITCSKDKTIKVWSRREMSPGDQDYPSPLSRSVRYPSYIIDVEQLDQQYSKMQPLKEFSLLMTLLGHTAAVNAIQVLDGQIVSASGDRTVKVWDIKSGICLKTVTGHLKGIACVQYDGKRIVSGSSDDSVRIFDRATGAEVACLRGHGNLVRTVQARFGDLPGNEDELEAEAQAVDRRYFQAQLSGSLPQQLTREQRQTRNDGSSDPRDICAWGAKIPPGGGGTRWARIVSGSYDECVIVWKRNSEGRWIPAHKLNQLEAVISAGGQPRSVPSRPQNHAQQQLAQIQQVLANAAQTQTGSAAAAPAATGQANQQATVTHNQHGANANNAQTATHAATTVQTTTQTSTPHSHVAVAGSSTSNQAPQASSSATAHTSTSTAIQPASQSSSTASSAAHPTQQQQQLPHHPGPVTTHPTWAHHPSVAQAIAQGNAAAAAAPQQLQPATATQQAQQPAQANAQQATQGQAQAPHAAPHHHHHHHHPNPRPAGNNASRVFKLQFDSRRILCCSQDPIIVGWDFANGDEEIISASRFFGEEL